MSEFQLSGRLRITGNAHFTCTVKTRDRRHEWLHPPQTLPCCILSSGERLAPMRSVTRTEISDARGPAWTTLSLRSG